MTAPFAARSSNPSRFAPPDAPAQTGEYSIFGLTPRDDEGAIRRRRRGFTAVLFGAATIIAVLYSGQRYVYSRLVHLPVSLRQVVPLELISAYLWAVLAPGVMWSARRFPVWVRGHPRNWLAQFVALLLFVVLHATLLLVPSLLLAPSRPAASAASLFAQQLAQWAALDTVVFCMLAAVQNAVVYYRVSKDRALRASQLEARLAQAQLQMLRMQLQPHFLFNTLHSISALMHRDVARADSMIAALSDLLRMSLQNLGAQEVPLQVELDFLERYAEVMRLRFSDRFAITIEVDPDARDARVPTLFLQPLVENAFRHGLGDQVGNGSIRVTVQRRGDQLLCEVIDDGRGLPSGFREGVGLATTRQRLAHLYGDRHSFSIRGGPGEGAQVRMSIPYRSAAATD